MGCYKIGSECCNNCVHWDCHSERKFIGNPPTEVYTDSNSDKCFLTGRNTLSKNCCGMFKHLGGITRTFAAEQKHAENDYMSNMLDACDETSRVFLQGMIGSIRMESAEHIAEIAQNQRRIEAANSENEKRSILIRNGMDSNASSEDQQAFEALYRGACDGEAEGLLYLGEAFRTNRYGAVQDAEKAVKLFKMAACKGSSGAEHRLADCYLAGEGVGKDAKIGRAWLARAAEHGDVIAKQKLTRMLEEEKRTRLIEEQAARDRAYQTELAKYVENNGMDPDASDMAKLLFSAMFESAKDGQVDAQLELADAYASHTKGAIGDKARALFWYKKAAKQGNAVAQNWVGRYYEMGWGLAEKDFGQAREWYAKSAAQGESVAQFNLGKMYYFGRDTEKDYAKAVKLFAKAAAGGRTDAKVFLGTCYRRGLGVEKCLNKAFQLYTEASKDQREAQFWIGRFHEKGWGGVEKNAVSAFEWYMKSAELGDVDAICAVGWAYQLGSGVVQDFSKAVEWFGKGADKGDGVCANNLARLYEEGKGVARDLEKALELFQKASEGKCKRAFYHLGRFYENGIGVDSDIEKAKTYFAKAAESGDEDAKAALERLG